MLKVLRWTAAGLALLVLSAISYRAYAQYRTAQSQALRGPSAVAEGLFVTLGGVRQWVQIRGEDTGNPVILVLHGGPGFSYVPLTPYFRGWEPYFTVVQWDRRGVGRTFGASGTTDSASITFERMAEDGLELAQWLRERLHKQRILLVGHSMGSVVGVLMAQQRPDLFYAYVGSDQIVDMASNEARSYDMLVERARATNDTKLLASIVSAGPPPYAVVDRWFAKQRVISSNDPIAPAFESRLLKAVMLAPEFGLTDLMAFGAGLKFSAATLLREMMTLDLRGYGPRFEVPVVLIEGELDGINPTALAVDWFETLHAASKRLAIVAGAGHNTMFTHRDEFLHELREHVRPLALERAVR
jgi:pimeloyl-ACP methyl ester carboxylesterase